MRSVHLKSRRPPLGTSEFNMQTSGPSGPFRAGIYALVRADRHRWSDAAQPSDDGSARTALVARALLALPRRTIARCRTSRLARVSRCDEFSVRPRTIPAVV